MLKKMFYLLSMVSLLAFATGCEEDKKDEAVVDYTSSGDITLGALSNAAPSAFDVEGIQAISIINTSVENQAKVDLVFANDDATVSSFIAPGNAVYNGTQYVGSWADAKRNNTLFKALTTFTVANWDALTSAQKIKDAYTNSASVASTKISGIGADKYYAVKTVGSFYAVIKVKSFTPSISGSAVINVKVANAASANEAKLFNF